MSTDVQAPLVDAQDVAPKRNEYKEWIKMTHEQMLAAQESGVLIGYHPDKGLGLVKPEETKKK